MMQMGIREWAAHNGVEPWSLMVILAIPVLFFLLISSPGLG